MFFGLATVVLLVDCKAGWLAMGIAAALGGGRIYLGYHYPSDVVGGGLLGILFVWAPRRLRTDGRVLRVASVPRSRRALFYAVAFYASFDIVTLLDDYRKVAAVSLHHLRGHML